MVYPAELYFNLQHIMSSTTHHVTCVTTCEHIILTNFDYTPQHKYVPHQNYTPHHNSSSNSPPTAGQQSFPSQGRPMP
jgi:hypothetical protein